MTNWLQQIQSMLAKKGEGKAGGSLSDMLAVRWAVWPGCWSPVNRRESC